MQRPIDTFIKMWGLFGGSYCYIALYKFKYYVCDTAGMCLVRQCTDACTTKVSTESSHFITNAERISYCKR